MITPPAELAVSLTEAKANLKIDGDDQDAAITAWIKGITAYAQNYTQRAFVHQTWRLTTNCFTDALQLPMSPLVSVASISYVDAAGSVQTLTVDAFVVDAHSEPGVLVPAAGVAWPQTAIRADAVTVEYVVGYGPNEVAVPAEVKLYILAKLAEQFDASARTEKPTVQSSFLDYLLDSVRVYA
jgi:uncharacterized phiE125 gp8 family phage protein